MTASSSKANSPESGCLRDDLAAPAVSIHSPVGARDQSPWSGTPRACRPPAPDWPAAPVRAAGRQLRASGAEAGAESRRRTPRLPFMVSQPARPPARAADTRPALRAMRKITRHMARIAPARWSETARTRPSSRGRLPRLIGPNLDHAAQLRASSLAFHAAVCRLASSLSASEARHAPPAERRARQWRHQPAQNATQMGRGSGRRPVTSRRRRVMKRVRSRCQRTK